MLVLQRLLDESIMIGEIEVKIVDVKGGKVKLGVIAPKDVVVDRKEVYEAKKAEREAAAHGSD